MNFLVASRLEPKSKGMGSPYPFGHFFLVSLCVVYTADRDRSLLLAMFGTTYLGPPWSHQVSSFHGLSMVTTSMESLLKGVLCAASQAYPPAFPTHLVPKMLQGKPN